MSRRAIQRINSWFDRVARVEFRLPGGFACSAFRACGLTGLVVAFTLAAGLAVRAQLLVAVLTVVTAGGVVTFLVLTIITKIMAGEEKLIYFHHEIAVVLGTVAILSLLHQPILPYLDVTVLGLGTFLAFGRIGCFLVGCCHGRPCRVGVRYRTEHGAAGFPEHYVDVRLFPVQVMESCLVSGIVVVGAALAVGGAPPGAVFGWYVVAYDAARFGLEFARGDADRRHFWLFSEAQWTAVALTCAVVWCERAGVLPLARWHIVAAAGLVVTLVAVAVTSRSAYRRSRRVLLQARHLREIAQHVQTVSRDFVLRGTDAGTVPSPAAAPRVARTSLGLQISAGRVSGPDGSVEHYTLSRAPAPLDASLARLVSRLVLLLRNASGPGESFEGRRGVFHLVVG